MTHKGRYIFLSAIILLLMVFSGSAAIHAENASTLNLGEIINEALANNPEIKASLKRYEAALARARFFRMMPDPRVEYEYDEIVASMSGIERNSNDPMRTIGFSQEVPYPSKLFLNRESALREAEALKEEHKEKENEIIQKVKETYYTLSLVIKEIQITSDTKVLLSQLIDTLTNRYSVGRATQGEVLKAQAEYSKLDNDSVLLEARKKIAQAMLKSILNRPQGAELSDPAALLEVEVIKVDKIKLMELVKDSRPELKAFRKMVAKSKTDYDLAKQEFMPDLMLRFKQEEENGSLANWAGMIGVTVPLWFWDKQYSFLKEAKSRLDEARSEYKAFENMVLYEVEAALAKAEAQERLAKLYETSFLPQTEAAFKASSIGFEAGRNDFLSLLDSERMLLEFKLDYANVLVDLEIAYAELEKAVGVSLKNGDMNEKQ